MKRCVRCNMPPASHPGARFMDADGEWHDCPGYVEPAPVWMLKLNKALARLNEKLK